VSKFPYGFYTITNTMTGKLYLGAGVIAARKNYHFSALQKGQHFNKHLQAAFNKYGAEKFRWEVEAYCDSSEEAFCIEQWYLLEWGQSGRLYNTSQDSAAPMTGRHHSAVSCKKIGDAERGEKHFLFGKHLPRATRKKLSRAMAGERNPNFGKHPSTAIRRKQSEAQTGKKRLPCSDETRRKIGVAQVGKKNHMFGKHHSVSAIKKIREGNRRKVVSVITRKLQSRAMTNYWTRKHEERKIIQ
jgi:group I intron endonuclease